MSANPEPMWSNSGVLTFTRSDDTEILAAGFRDVTITAQDEHTELYTFESRFRDTVKRYEHNVNVELTFVKFSMEFAQEWLGGEGSKDTSSQENADPMLFNVNSVSPSESGGFERTVDVRGDLTGGQVQDIEVTSAQPAHYQVYVEGDVYRQILGDG